MAPEYSDMPARIENKAVLSEVVSTFDPISPSLSGDSILSSSFNLRSDNEEDRLWTNLPNFIPMFKFFSSNQPFVVFLLPVLPLGNLVLEYFYPTLVVAEKAHTNLWLIKPQVEFNWWLGIFAIFLLTVNGMLVNSLFNRNEFYDKNTYLPSIIYVIIACLFPFSVLFNGEALAHTFIILMISQFFRLKQNEDGRAASFFSAFFLGGAATLNPIYILMLPFLWMSIARIRPIIGREYALTLFGLSMPMLYLFYVNPVFYESLFVFDAKLVYNQFNGFLLWIPYVVVSVLLILSYKNILSRLPTSTIRYKRLLSVVVFVFLYTLIISVATTYIYTTSYYLSAGAIVLSLILPYAYLEARVKTIVALLFYILVAVNLVKFVL